MSKYNDQYYIVFKNYNDNTLYLSALQKSADRDYGFYKLDINDEPLYFENAYKEDDKKNGLKHSLSSTHMNMNYVIVNNELREKLKDFDIEHTQLYPSVIIDDDDKRNERYWLINIYERLECLDFDKSDIEDYDPADRKHEFNRFCFSDSLMDQIPEEKRLMIRPYKDDMGYTFFHQKVVDIFLEYGVTNLRFIKVSDWEAGDEFQ